MSTKNRFLYAGYQEEMPTYLKRKVFPTNLIVLLLLCGISIPFSIISIIYFPSLAIYPASGGLVCVGVMIANFNGGIYYSRVLLAIFPITLGAIYNAYLTNEGDQPLPALYLIELSFTMIPFVIFDLSEKFWLFIISILCAAIILTFPLTNDWFQSSENSMVLRKGWLASLTIGLAIISSIGCILGLALLNKESELESESLIKAMDEKAKILELSEIELKENIKKIEAAQLEEQKRNWATEGIAQISDILRSNLESQDIYDKITSAIVRYIKANQAGFYVIDRNDDKENIRLAACYAYERKKHINQEFIPNEAGLLGQAYLEGEYIYLTDIPQSYVQITSGLGQSTPTCLIIMPLKVNDIIEGIFELASFRALEQYEIAFLMKVGESVASFIQTNRINERTSLLLNETRNLAEEMRAQEEELRQNLEEMTSTHEENNRKEAQYIRRIQELEKSLAMASN